MQKVQMIVGGREALVDADMAPLVARKSQLVVLALDQQTLGKFGEKALLETMKKIQRLNRKIRPSVVFL
jgi:hypothetical protein